MMPKTLGPNRCNRGSILPLVAVSAPLLLGGAGFAVDVAGWYRGNQRLQMAADAAALESSRLLTNASAAQSDFTAAATSAAKAVVSSSTGTLASPTVIVAPDRTKVAVTLTSTAPRYFTQYFTSTPITLSASATVGPAGSSGSTGSGSGGGNCVLALSTSATKAINAYGTGGITANDCGVFSNSSDQHSIFVQYYTQSNGGPAINATGSGTVGAVGTVDYFPVNTDYVSPMPSQFVSSLAADPYANLTAPPPGACMPYVDYSKYQSTPWQMQPGTYCQNLTFAAGMKVFFNPGLYSIINGNLTFTSGSQAQSSPGASFYLGGSTPGTVQWNGGTSGVISATTSGWMKGILIYRDRSAAPSGSNLSGGTAFTVSGVIYLPTDTLVVNGNAQLTYLQGGSGLQVIAQTIEVSGSAHITAGGTLPSIAAARMALIQ